jgi:hypothetical protein
VTNALLQGGPQDGEFRALQDAFLSLKVHRSDGAVGEYARGEPLRIGHGDFTIYRWQGWVRETITSAWRSDA